MTTALKNLYESIIQDMIVDGIVGMTPEIKKMIADAPIDKRRSMILTILEENNVEHRLLCSKIQKTITSNNASETKHIKDVVQMLREYVKVSAVEVKTMGEVMTPIELVEEMLDTLPDEVWTNPSLRWLDPCNGVGTFVSVIIYRLMKGLTTFQPDEKLRYKHIMENMIYVCELQAKNVFLYLYAFDPKDEYALNIYCGSYLDNGFDAHMQLLGVENFDVIVMNPPYQVLQEGNTKTQSLWDKFVKKVLETSLITDGYLVAINPSGWRNVNGLFKNIQMLLKSRQMLYLEVHNQKDGVKTFGVKTDYDFYCIRNTENLGNFNTKIKCQDGTIERVDISKMEFIPNGMYNAIQNLIAKKGEEKVKLLADSSYHTQRLEQMSKEQTEEFKYACAYTVMKKGTKFWYSNTNTKGHFGQPKLIWGNGEIDFIGSLIDINGDYGLTQFAYAIVDNPNNLSRMKTVFDSKEFKAIMNMCTIGKFSMNNKVVALFRRNFWVDFLG
jgi:hypothetical protein